MSPKLLWTAWIFLSLVVIYVWLIRPRLAKSDELREFYAHADSFWERLRLRIKGWGVMIVLTFSLIISELPSLLTELQLLDFEYWFGPYAKRISQFLILLGIILRANMARGIGQKTGPEDRK
jgi:hypothetical protein